ncbi:hypothetical protein AVEN_226601-2-1, partial [Araneus ventricosus]
SGSGILCSSSPTRKRAGVITERSSRLYEAATKGWDLNTASISTRTVKNSFFVRILSVASNDAHRLHCSLLEAFKMKSMFILQMTPFIGQTPSHRL